MPSTERLWQNTPLIRSSALSDKTGCEVYLKIETFQHSGSFKGRGVSHFTNQVLKAYLRHTNGEQIDTGAIAADTIKVDVADWPKPVDTSGISKEKLPHLIIASAGNAGLAAASAARILGVRCTIFVPDEQASMVRVFERHNTNGTVEVRVGGVNYAAAAKAAKAFAEELGERGVLVPAYDDPLVWQGNSTIMHEIAEQLPPDTKPDTIFCSVGGAGLIGGLMLGCESIPGYQNVPIVGLEPHGSAAFYHSVQRNRNASSKIPEGSTETQVLVNNPFDGLIKGQYGTELSYEQKLVHLGSVVSRASSLGASAASVGAVTIGLRRRGPLYCVTVSDERAMDAALKFAADHAVISELACSITLVPAYTPKLLNRLVPASSAISNGLQKKPVLVFVVCGGSKGSFHDLCKFEKELANWNSLNDEVWVDGTQVELQ